MQKAKVVLISLLLVTGVTAMTGSVLAQENSTETTTSEESQDSVVMEVDDRTTLVDYEFNGDTLTITLDSDYSRTAVLSDMFVTGSGAKQLPRKRVTLAEGRSTITFEVTEWNGNKGATIATSGGAVAITEASAGSGGIGGTFTGNTVIVFFAVGGLVGTGMVFVVSYKKKLDYTSEIERKL